LDKQTVFYANYLTEMHYHPFYLYLLL
jgi:hypothetical protein